MSGEDEPVDPMVGLRAQMDQMLMLAPEVGRAARAWFEVFRSEGFGDRESLYLTAVQMVQQPGSPP